MAMAMADDNTDENTKTNTTTGDNHKNDYGEENQQRLADIALWIGLFSEGAWLVGWSSLWLLVD